MMTISELKQFLETLEGRVPDDMPVIGINGRPVVAARTPENPYGVADTGLVLVEQEQAS